jgi:hypothetical protein
MLELEGLKIDSSNIVVCYRYALSRQNLVAAPSQGASFASRINQARSGARPYCKMGHYNSAQQERYAELESRDSARFCASTVVPTNLLKCSRVTAPPYSRSVEKLRDISLAIEILFCLQKKIVSLGIRVRYNKELTSF